MTETKAELGKRLKEKFPVYKNIPDEELAEKLTKKHPEVQAQVPAEVSGEHITLTWPRIPYVWWGVIFAAGVIAGLAAA